MRVQVKRSVLKPLIDRATGAASRTSAIPALQNIRLTADESSGRLCAIGSDSEVSVRASTSQVEIYQSGDIVLPPLIKDIVSNCSDTSEIALHIADGGLYLEAGSYEGFVKLVTEPYPTISLEHEPVATLPKDLFLELLDRARRPVESGNVRTQYAFVDVQPEFIQSSDAVRSVRMAFNSPVELLLSARIAGDLPKLFRDASSSRIEVGITEQSYSFQIDDLLVVAARHQVVYPDIESMLYAPVRRNDCLLVVDRRLLQDAIARVRATADPDTSYLSLELTRDKLCLSTLDKHGNASRESLPVRWPYGDVTLGVNHKYLSTMLETMKSPQVNVRIRSDEMRSLLFEDEGFSGVVMQLRKQLAAAVQGSNRTRAAQSAPDGWRRPVAVAVADDDDDDIEYEA